MKKFLLTLTAIFMCIVAYAQTETINWYMDDGTTYTTTTCESGGDIILPATPTKRGYTFVGWADYTPIEYLESTGTQYIDTGIAFTDSLKNYPFTVDFKVELIEDIPNHSLKYIAGASNVMLVAQIQWDTTDDCMSMRPSGNITTASACRTALGTPIRARFDFDQRTKRYTLYDGVNTTTYDIPNNGNLNTSNYNLYLFKANGTSSTVPIRIYNFSYESNGVKIRDFIPVLDPTGTPCMYDKVEKKYYYNAGTGQFIAGPMIGE